MTTGPGPRSSLEHEVTDTGDDSHGPLADPHRRHTLHCLSRADGPLSVEDLVDELVAWETGRPVAEQSSTGRTGFEISLVHCDLPKLAAAGLVEYDETERTVALAGDGQTLVADLPAACD